MRAPDLALIGAAALLAALAVWPWVAPGSAPLAAGAMGESAPPTPPIAALPPLATFAAVSERPLFSPSRRPPPDGKSATRDAGDAGRYRLLGLLTVGDTRRALVADGNRRFEIAEGVTLDSWTVTKIEQDRVVLSSPTGRIEMRLRPAEADREGPPGADKRAR